jgi:hypothetical protein
MGSETESVKDQGMLQVFYTCMFRIFRDLEAACPEFTHHSGLLSSVTAVRSISSHPTMPSAGAPQAKGSRRGQSQHGGSI